MNGGERRSVTMSHIADAAGVSKRTVSAVLNPRPESNVRFSEGTRRKVLDAAEELGYRPNRTARQFVRRRHGAIGVMMPWIECVPLRTLGLVLKFAKWRDLMVLLEETPADPGERPKLLKEDCVDGLVAFGPLPEHLSAELGALPIPVLEVNTNRRTGPLCITYDEEGACARAAERLARAGRRSVALLLEEPGEHYSVGVRRASLEKEAADRGLRFEVLEIPRAEGPQALRRLAESRSVDSCVVYTDWMAIPLYRAADRAGLRIPQDLSVIGFNDSLLCAALAPPLTTLSVDADSLAQETVALICDAISGEATDQEALRMPYSLTERGSVAGEETAQQ